MKRFSLLTIALSCASYTSSHLYCAAESDQEACNQLVILAGKRNGQMVCVEQGEDEDEEYEIVNENPDIATRQFEAARRLATAFARTPFMHPAAANFHIDATVKPLVREITQTATQHAANEAGHLANHAGHVIADAAIGTFTTAQTKLSENENFQALQTALLVVGSAAQQQAMHAYEKVYEQKPRIVGLAQNIAQKSEELCTHISTARDYEALPRPGIFPETPGQGDVVLVNCDQPKQYNEYPRPTQKFTSIDEEKN